MIERDDPYSASDFPPGAHQLWGYLDINFNESAQYGHRATKTQGAWLIVCELIYYFTLFKVDSDSRQKVQYELTSYRFSLMEYETCSNDLGRIGIPCRSL